MTDGERGVVVITGASRGIGAAAAILAAQAGFDVVVNYRQDKVGAGNVVERIEAAGGRAMAVQADTGQDADIVRMFEADGIPRSRLYIKIASTFAGIKAAEQLERQNINCNLTLLFSFAQAVACAQAKVSLISPFVGRLDDMGMDGMELIESIKDIYDAYPQYSTEILVASIRSPRHVERAAEMGADVGTLPPRVLWDMYQHPLTSKGLDDFLSDWGKTGQSIL